MHRKSERAVIKLLPCFTAKLDNISSYVISISSRTVIKIEKSLPGKGLRLRNSGNDHRAAIVVFSPRMRAEDRLHEVVFRRIDTAY